MLAHYHISFIWFHKSDRVLGFMQQALVLTKPHCQPSHQPLAYFLTYVLTEPRTCLFTRIRCMSSFYFGSGDRIQDLMLCGTVTVEPSPSPTLPHFSVCLKTFRIAHQPQIQPRNTHKDTASKISYHSQLSNLSVPLTGNAWCWKFNIYNSD